MAKVRLTRPTLAVSGRLAEIEAQQQEVETFPVMSTSSFSQPKTTSELLLRQMGTTALAEVYRADGY